MCKTAVSDCFLDDSEKPRKHCLLAQTNKGGCSPEKRRPLFG